MINKSKFVFELASSFLSYKFSASEDNLSYRTGSFEGEVHIVTSTDDIDIAYNSIVLIKDDGSGMGLIWTMGVPFARSLSPAQIDKISSFLGNDSTITLSELISKVEGVESSLSNKMNKTAVSVRAITSIGEHIADISINGTNTEIYAPKGGSGTITDVQLNGDSVVKGGVAYLPAYPTNADTVDSFHIKKVSSESECTDANTIYIII